MYICVCNAITEREICQAVELGCDSYRKLHNELGVGTCCGKCKNETTRVLKRHVVAMEALNNSCREFGVAL